LLLKTQKHQPSSIHLIIDMERFIRAQFTSRKHLYDSAPADRPTELLAPSLPFSLVFRAEPGREDLALKIAAYETASRRRIPPPDFGPV
jgi:hypothetical protein